METNKKHELISRLDSSEDKLRDAKFVLKRSLDPNSDEDTIKTLLNVKDELLELIACINSL